MPDARRVILERSVMEDNICPDYNMILDEYIKVAGPLLEKLKNHIRGCPVCQKYLLENRDAFALYMIGISDDEFKGRMAQ